MGLAPNCVVQLSHYVASTCTPLSTFTSSINLMLEIACFNTASALAAAKSGADRIELCADYGAGGTTPDLDSLRVIREEIRIPINVMIRPREGNFLYSETEFEQMKAEIQAFKSLANGFVFGILDDKKCVDTRKNQELVTLAAPLPCTFHRAFDQVPDLLGAGEDIVSCGFTSVLTSGGKENAVTGAGRVSELQKQFDGKITFILGGGVRSTNIQQLKQKQNIQWYHSAAITTPGENVDEREVQSLQKLLSLSAA